MWSSRWFRTGRAFTVEAVREDATIEMIGESVLSFATEATGRIIVQNNGSVDLHDLIVTLQIAPGTKYRINLPANVEGGAEQRDEEFTFAEGIEPIWIDRLRTGRSYEFESPSSSTTPVPSNTSIPLNHQDSQLPFTA